MKKIAIEQCVPQKIILLESKSTSTFENLENSKVLLSRNGLSSAIIVTEPFHMARARLVARSLHISAQYATAIDSPCWSNGKYMSRYFLKEPFAIAYYVLTGKITLSAF